MNRERKETVMKSDYRGYRNLVADYACQLDRLARNENLASEEMRQDYPLYTLYCMLLRASRTEGRFALENLHYGKNSGRLLGFDMKLNLYDADVKLSLSTYQGRIEAQLRVGGRYCLRLHCANGAYAHVMNELFSQVATVGVAA